MKKVPGWLKFGCALAAAGLSLFLLVLSLRSYFASELHGRTRAMVSRVRSDLETYDTAAKTYFEDKGQFPASASAMTSPISYISFLPQDPFVESNTYRFFSDGSRFIAYSAGPDKTYQIDPEQDLTKGELALKLKSYDATNGSRSQGDIYRSRDTSQTSANP